MYGIHILKNIATVGLYCIYDQLSGEAKTRGE